MPHDTSTIIYICIAVIFTIISIVLIKTKGSRGERKVASVPLREEVDVTIIS